MLEYGDRFEKETKRPYDFFTVMSSNNIHSDQPVLSQLNIIGRLLSKGMIDSEKHFLSVGLYQHFDYFDSDTISDVSAKTPYKICTPASIGGGVMYKKKQVRRWDFDGYVHLNAVLLGGALSDYYKVEGRTYNLASGVSAKVGCNLAYKKDRLFISAIYSTYHMFTWKGYPQDIDWADFNPKTLNAQGDPSKAILHAAGIRISARLHKRFFLTGTFVNYTRQTKYRYYEKVFSNTSEGRIMLTYKL